MSTNYLAQGSMPLGPINGIGTDLANPGTNSPTVAARIISTAIGILTVVAVVYFLFQLLSGGISIISAGGDKGAYEDARRKITTGVIGLVITIAGIFIFNIVATLLGIEGILNLTTIIPQL